MAERVLVCTMQVCWFSVGPFDKGARPHVGIALAYLIPGLQTTAGKASPYRQGYKVRREATQVCWGSMYFRILIAALKSSFAAQNGTGKKYWQKSID